MTKPTSPLQSTVLHQAATFEALFDCLAWTTGLLGFKGAGGAVAALVKGGHVRRVRGGFLLNRRSSLVRSVVEDAEHLVALAVSAPVRVPAGTIHSMVYMEVPRCPHCSSPTPITNDLGDRRCSGCGRDWAFAPRPLPQGALVMVDESVLETREARRARAVAFLSSFAEKVLATGRKLKIGRFGPNKVFISYVWRAMQAEWPNRDNFEAALIEADRKGLLSLSRADLMSVMDPRDVRESRVTSFGASFHFVVV